MRNWSRKSSERSPAYWQDARRSGSSRTLGSKRANSRVCLAVDA
jgi:hypothetical protein